MAGRTGIRMRKKCDEIEIGFVKFDGFTQNVIEAQRGWRHSPESNSNNEKPRGMRSARFHAPDDGDFPKLKHHLDAATYVMCLSILCHSELHLKRAANIYFVFVERIIKYSIIDALTKCWSIKSHWVVLFSFDFIEQVKRLRFRGDPTINQFGCECVISHLACVDAPVFLAISWQTLVGGARNGVSNQQSDASEQIPMKATDDGRFASLKRNVNFALVKPSVK